MTAIKGLAGKAALGLAVGMLLLAPVAAEAHCDTMDGPTVKDALKAMETDNVNYALKWVQPRYEGEVTRAFNLSMKVKDINEDTREALINSQNRISYVFLSNAASSVSLNSSLFASTDSLH
ncbi:DUF6448 family protein [uncultured Dialister sp.]|jgi:hypothetical protein|uniref:DUF6448 family protein n=1 Tax=uncultured Dialister sp. TaxID=278064 RepID=UPI00260F9C74|nr:DUF6448 family protein [uncultured Dialister sp.]